MVKKYETKDSGKKYDDGKLRWDLLPIEIIEHVVEILSFGAEKYGDNNWQKVKKHRYVAAFFRHWVAYLKGEYLDSESGRPHLAHCLTNIIFIFWKEENKIE